MTLVDIRLTELVKGNSTTTVRKECPNCKGIMVFGILNGKIVFQDEVIHWMSNNRQLVKCINCDTTFQADIIDP
jgi:hypothetical protein